MAIPTESPEQDALYMQRALQLAAFGRGYVAPNPMVGCVIVREGRIIGEGYHKQYGDAHAEVNAVRQLSHEALLREATVYVSLEPCAHFGKTPPCADMLAHLQPKRVVVAMQDPNPLVAGKGLAKIEAAGISTTLGVMQSEAEQLNARFLTYIQHQRPYIILKWAASADNLMALPGGKPVQISNVLSQQWVHKKRSEEAAILVGTNTALNDNPALTLRYWQGRQPLRVLIDRHLRLPATLQLFDNQSATLCYNYLREACEGNITWVKIRPDEDEWTQILRDLHTRKIQSVIVEGGAAILQDLINRSLWDEAWVIRSPQYLREGIAAPVLPILPRHTFRLGDDGISEFFALNRCVPA